MEIIKDSKTILAEIMRNSYGNKKLGLNCAGFIVDRTSLFSNNTGEKFEPYSKQVHFMNLLREQDKIITVLKPRQSGFSTAIVGKAMFEAYFNIVPEIVIVSASRTQAEKVLDRVRDGFKSMHESLQPSFEKENTSFLKMQNGCKIYALSSNPDSARGFTGIIYLDEYAILGSKDSYEIWKALYPSITHGGRIVVVSTPKGKVGKFYDLATNKDVAIDNKSRVIYKIDWRDIPFIVDAVKNKGLFQGMTQEEIQQEYELSFLTDDEEPYFSDDFIMTYYIEKEREIPLLKSYSDLDIPDEYFIDLNKPLDVQYYIKNNENLTFHFNSLKDSQHITEYYDKFVGAWDIASVNDDSIFKIAGRIRGTADQYDIVAEFLLNSISSDTIQQAKYVKRLIMAFQLESLCGDYKGLGRGVLDFLENSNGTDDQIAEYIQSILIKYDTSGQNKIDNYSETKTQIREGKRKRRYDGDSYDKKALKQFQNVYAKGGKIVKKNGKDDYADCEALLTVAIAESGAKDGFFTIDMRKGMTQNSGGSGLIFPVRY